MGTTRRTALAMLGMGTASALGSESFVEPPKEPGRIQSASGAFQKERYARAFEQLAAELRRDSVEVESLHLKSSLEPDTIADCHELVLRFRYMPEV